MSARLRALAARRAALVARSADERAQLGRQLEPAVQRLAALGRVAETLREPRVLLWVGAAALVLVGPRRLRPWVLRAAPLVALLYRV